MSIGERIREERAKLGLSQEELAERLYVSRVTISHWETGKTLPDVQSMMLLAQLCGITLDEMVREDVDEMRAIVEKDEGRTKVLAVALGIIDVMAMTALIVCSVAARDALGPLVRLMSALFVLILSVTVLAVRRGQGASGNAKNAAGLLGAATGAPLERARQSGAANGMLVVLQAMAGIGVAVTIMTIGDLLMGGTLL